jgi:hypothetical protein
MRRIERMQEQGQLPGGRVSRPRGRGGNGEGAECRFRLNPSVLDPSSATVDASRSHPTRTSSAEPSTHGQWW